MNLQKIFEQLKPGDIILDKGDSYIAKAISYFDNSPYSHAMLYVGNNEVVHATRFGVRSKSIVDALLYSEYFQVYRCKDNSIPLNKVIDKGKYFQGTSYGTDQIILLTLILASCKIVHSAKMRIFIRKIFERASSLLIAYREDDHKLTCAELVYRSFSEVCGKDVIKINRGISQPNKALEVLEGFSCHDAWMISSNEHKTEAQIREELLILFEDLMEEEKNTLQTFDINKPYSNTFDFVNQDQYLTICNQVKHESILKEKIKIQPQINVNKSLKSFFEANCNFLTPGDIARSPSLFSIFQKPILLNRG